MKGVKRGTCKRAPIAGMDRMAALLCLHANPTPATHTNAAPAVPAAAEISPKHGLLTGIYDTIGMVNSGELSK